MRAMPRSRETPKRSALAVSPAFRFRLAARPYRTARLVSASASRTPCSAISSSSSRLYSSIACSHLCAVRRRCCRPQLLAAGPVLRLLRPLGVLGVREPVRAVQQLRVAQNLLAAAAVKRRCSHLAAPPVTQRLLAPPRREQVLQQVGRAVVHLAEHGRGLVAAVGAPLHPVRVQGRLERARQRHKPAVLGRVDCSGCHLGKPQADRVVRADQRPACGERKRRERGVRCGRAARPDQRGRAPAGPLTRGCVSARSARALCALAIRPKFCLRWYRMNHSTFSSVLT